jgi:hypothetical protein
MGIAALWRGKGGGMKRPRKISMANTAPPASGTEPLVTSAEALRWQRQQKYSPLPFLKPEMLVRALDAFEHGNLCEPVLLFEKMAERDDVIASVKPKREKDVSQLDRQIVKTGDGPEADAHAEVLEEFWNAVRCYNSYDRNERGGFRRLVKQMMTAVSFRYAAHHIVWQPRADGSLRALFELVPLWQFENRTGRLRYLPAMTGTAGEILADGEWMVTTGDGLMIPCSIGYLAKRSAYNDWLIFSEKFSVPGVLGRTTGRKGSAEGEAMRSAVESFGHDWTAVVYGDDGTHAEPIKLVQAAGNPSGMPMPAVIERVDRKFASLYRGADLSSMSSNSGEGTGASLQEKETDILRRDDAEMIAETLEEVSRMVIEWHFGRGVEPLARVELVVPVQEDTTKVIQNGLALAAAGASVSLSNLMERAGLAEATEAADRVQGSQGSAGVSPASKTQDGKTQDARQEGEAAVNAYNPNQPRNEQGEWDFAGGGGSSAVAAKDDSSRLGRARRTIDFKEPVKTPLGDVLSYSWQSKLIETDSGTAEGVVLKRVSDWDEATTNAETGRDIVHQFTIRKPDGTMGTVSLESLSKSAGESAKGVKSIVKTARALPLREAELKQREEHAAVFNTKYAKEEEKIERDYAYPRVNWKELTFPKAWPAGYKEAYMDGIFIGAGTEKSSPGASDSYSWVGLKMAQTKWKEREIPKKIGMEWPDLDRIDQLRRLIKRDKAKLSAAGVTENATVANSREPIANRDGFVTLKDGDGNPYVAKLGEKDPDPTRVPKKIDRMLDKKQDDQIDREKKDGPNWEPDPEDLKDDADAKAAAAKADAEMMERDRLEYEKELKEGLDPSTDFPEVSDALKRKLPLPQDMDPSDPMKSEVERIYERFKKEINRRVKIPGSVIQGKRIIRADAADEFFAPRGTSPANLDYLRESLNEEGFEFDTPAQMLEAVYESLEGRKVYGTKSRAAAENAANARRGEGAETFGEWIADVRRPEWVDALQSDLQPLGKALASAMQAGDDAAVRGALKKLSARLPDFLNTPGLETWLEGKLTESLTEEPE